jgi:hypothetical protein
MSGRSMRTVERACKNLLGRGRHPLSACQRLDRIVIVGAVYELSTPTPSLPEIGALLGFTHSTIGKSLAEWRQMEWRTRYNWLIAVDMEVKWQTEIERMGEPERMRLKSAVGSMLVTDSLASKVLEALPSAGRPRGSRRTGGSA